MVGIIGVVAAVSAEEALQAAGVILLLRGDGLLLGHLDELERRVGVGFPFRRRGHRFVGRGLDPRPCGFLVEPVLLRAERRQLCDLGVPPQLLLVHRSAVLLLHLPVRVKVEDAARALRREHPIRRLLRRLDGVDEIAVLGVLDAVGREGVGDAARPLRHRPVLVPKIVPGLVHRGSSTEERPRARVAPVPRDTRRQISSTKETGSKKSQRDRVGANGDTDARRELRVPRVRPVGFPAVRVPWMRADLLPGPQERPRMRLRR